MPIIETNFGTFFYAEFGAKIVTSFPVILIHGAASSHLGWSGELRRLPNHRVLTLDLPGHGRATGQGCNSIKKYSQAVLALLDALAIPQAVFMGHSMGGAIALQLGADAPQRTAGLILMGTGAALPVSPFILENILTNKQTVIEKINQWSWAQTAKPDLQVLGLKALEAVPAAIIHGDYTACHHFDLRDSLANIHLPALVIGGTLDKMTPMVASQFLAANLPEATLKIVEGGGHWMMLEQTKVVAGYVSAWLAENAFQK